MSSSDIVKDHTVVDTHESHALSSDDASEIDFNSTKPYIDIVVKLDDSEIKRRSSWWYKIGFFLYDSLDKHEHERSFLFKLDFFLLSSACLGYFIKTLNQNNIGTAYVNGMKEHYDMKGNDYNLMVTLWTVGYIIGQIPSNLILHRISARYYLAGLELSWAILTLLTITPKSLHGLYALRFLIGLTESGYFPGMEYLIGSWYSKKELTKRAAFFGCAGTAAGLASGPLQQAILSSTWAHKHLQPFQWMFVIDAAVSFPVALYTLFVDPNTPSTTNAWYFSRRDKLVALERRRRDGSQLNIREPYTLAKIKSFFNTWHIWVFPPLFLFYNNSGQPTTSQAFPLWIKTTLKLDSYYYNNYPIIISGGGIAMSLFVAYTNDYYRGKLTAPFLYLMFGMFTFGCALVAAWNIPRGLHWAAYFIYGVPLTMGQPLIFTWINNILHHDDMKRNFVVVVTNTLAYVTSAWTPMLMFNQNDAPYFHKGFVYIACLASAGIVFVTIALVLTIRDNKREERVKIEHSESETEFA